jgi:hypothetical protein
MEMLILYVTYECYSIFTFEILYNSIQYTVSTSILYYIFHYQWYNSLFVFILFYPSYKYFLNSPDDHTVSRPYGTQFVQARNHTLPICLSNS